jgi:hypothetical protein
MEKFEIIKESTLTEIKFDTLCQSKVYAVFDLDQFFVYDNGKLHLYLVQTNIPNTK